MTKQEARRLKPGANVRVTAPKGWRHRCLRGALVEVGEQNAWVLEDGMPASRGVRLLTAVENLHLDPCERCEEGPLP